MDRRQISHDILNIIERLRIMHDLIKDNNYEDIPKEELMNDMNESLALLKTRFESLAQ